MAKLSALVSDVRLMVAVPEVNICVTIMDRKQLKFQMKQNTTGKQLLDHVLKTMGLQEEWFFGLAYADSTGELTWLRLDKKFTQQDVTKEDPLQFKFRARFFPEVSEELIQEITQRLFFLQAKEAILNEEMYCPPEKAMLLSSYSVQAQYGDYSRDVHKPGYLAQDRLVPQRVLLQQKLTKEQWVDKMQTLHEARRGVSREDSMMEYLKMAQDLEMYGVKYFEINNKKGTHLWLGVHALGLNVYKQKDKLTPDHFFQWKEIRQISYNNTKFTIKLIADTDSNLVFYVPRRCMIKRILAECVGNYGLYTTRRTLDTIEVQHMKAEARGQKQHKQMARNLEHAQKEKERARAELEEQTRRALELEQERTGAREEVERLEKEHAQKEKERAQEKLEEKERAQEKLEEQTRQALELERERMRAREEVERLEKERLATEEAMAELTKRAAADQTKNQEQWAAELSEFTAKIGILEEAKRRKEEEALEWQRKAMSAQEDLEKTKDELKRAMMRTTAAPEDLEKTKDELKRAMMRTTAAPAPTDGENVERDHESHTKASVVLSNVHGRCNEEEVKERPIEAQKSAIEAQKSAIEAPKNQSTERQLQALSVELARTQDVTKMTQDDVLHVMNVKAGRDKYQTLWQIRRGHTKQRIDEFESM